MPVLDAPALRSPRWLWNAHLQTIYPSQLRKVPAAGYVRERLELPDGDFLDLDWAYATPGSRSSRLVVLLHGLEGDTYRHYVVAMARQFQLAGWDALAYNYRSCSGVPNRLPRLYHHGDTPDLHSVVQHALAIHNYSCVGLVGVSMGGNILMKYLGEDDRRVPAQVVGGVAISAPTDLSGCELALARAGNRIYMWRFLDKLGRKLAVKNQQYPGLVDLNGYRNIRRFRDFDDRYTAPLHGFSSADDYYNRVSSGPNLPDVRRPLLLLNAANDPFLAPSCFPFTLASQHPFLHLEVPALGGHVGFLVAGQLSTYAEVRGLSFLQQVAST